MDIIKRLALLFLLLILLIFGLLYYVTSTDSGMQRAFSIAEGYLGDDLSIGSAKGKLIGPGSFENIEFKNAAGLTLAVRSVDYDWSPKLLISKELDVDRLKIDGITVRIPEPQESDGEGSKEPFKLSDLKIPLAVKADSVSITDITIYPPGTDKPLIIDEILLQFDGEGDALELLNVSVKSPQGNLVLEGDMSTSGNWPLDFNSDWNFIHEQYGEIIGKGAVQGNLQSLDIKHEVDGFIDANVDVVIVDVFGDLSWDGKLSASSDDMGALGESLAGIPAALDLKTDGTLDKYKASGKFTTNHPETGPLSTSFNLTGDLKQIVLADSAVKFEESSTELTYEGTVDLETLAADVTVDWAKLEYPLVADPKLVLSPSGSLHFTGTADDYKAELNTLVEQELAGELNVTLVATGSTEEVFIETFTVDGPPTSVNVSGGVDLVSRKVDIDGNWKDVRWPLMGDDELIRSSKADFSVKGTLDDYQVELSALVEQELAGELKVALVAGGSTKAVSIETFTVDGVPTVIDISGGVDLESREVDIEGNWKDVRWPLTGDAILVQSSKADFSVKGTLDDYQVDAELSLVGKDIPKGDWKISTRGSTEKLSGLELTGDVLDGQVSAIGDVEFVPQPAWDLAIESNGINPGLQWPDHEGRISFTTDTKGRMTDSGPDLTANIRELSGNYRGQALAGGGNVKFANGEFSADGLSAKVGSATIDLDGALGEELDLKWKMDADQIASLVPGVSGDIALDGKISGSRDAPMLEFNLDASDFKSGSLTSKSLKGGGAIDLTGTTVSDIDITGESLIVAGYQWQDIKIAGGGKPEQHNLSVSMTGDAPDIALELTGGVEGEKWSGSLDKLALLETPIGDWNLHEPVGIEATKNSVATGILCLTNLPAVLCADTTWQVKSGVKSRLGLQSFNSELFSDLMPPDITIDAPLSGKVDFTMRPGGKPGAVGEFNIPQGRVQFTSQGDVITAILGDSTATVNLADDQLITTADLALGEIGTLQAETVITDLYGEQNLRGTIGSEIQDISLAGIGASQLSSIDGAFASDVQLGGTLKAPQVVGGVSLVGFGAEIPSLSLKLEDGNIKAVSDGDGNLVVTGQIKSGDGELAIDGSVNPETGAMDLQLKGEDFRVANAKRQKAVISPDLRITIDDDMISVLGDLVIPSAFITAGGDSGVITESADVKVKQDQDIAEEAEPSAESRVRLGINVKLGDDVRVKAGQFDGALGGGLSLEQVPGKVPTGSGVIEVVSGDYLVYGQNLTMEKGRILFGGGPLDNPALEIDVFRDVTDYDVKAGVQVRGTAQVPLLVLQSEPEQTDANTLSFILFGKPVGEGISYTLGRFITPDLYISYGIDILTQVQAFNMRYRISNRLALIATKSTESGADFFYTIER